MASSPDAGASASIDYVAVEQSQPFQELKRKQRSFIFPMAVVFLLWYFVYVLLAGFVPEFMAQRIGESHITVGLLFGLAQFVTTFAITMLYVSFANKRLDPPARALREELEKQEAAR